MKEQLRTIFLDLSSKKLSEAEALEKIRAIKAAQKSSDVNTLYASPTWKLAENPQNNQSKIAQHHLIWLHATSKNQQKISEQLPQVTQHTITSSKETLAENYTEIALSCFKIIQNLLTNKLQGTTYVQIVVGTSVEEKLYQGLAALLKTATLENHNLIGQLIVTEEQNSVKEIVQQLTSELKQSTDALIRYEGGKRHVKQLVEIHDNSIQTHSNFRENGVYLITGGFGGLGIAFAKKILQQLTKVNIVLTGRSQLTAEKKQLLEQLSSEHKKVQYISLNVADKNQTRKVIETILHDYKKLHGIIHAAGINKDNFILKKSIAEFKEVLQAKVSGAYNIDEVTKEIDLDFIMLCSSIASWFGNPGQADYAVANAFMDEYAEYRNALVKKGKRSGKTLTINWPLWEEGGMEIDEEIKAKLFEQTGFIPLDTHTGNTIFQYALQTDQTQILGVKGNIKKIKETLFTKVTSVQKEELKTIKPLDANELSVKTTGFLRDEFSKIIKLPAREIETHLALEKYGIDSILAMNLTSQLEKTFGKLSKTLFFEYHTIDELSAYFTKNFASVLTAKFSPDATHSSIVSNNEKVATHTHSIPRNNQKKKRKISREPQIEYQLDSHQINQNEPIAVIGLSGRYPESENIQAFWKNLQQGKDCIIEVPKDRWDWEKHYSTDRTEPNRHYSKWGGFIAGVDEFDPRFFNISPREAKNIDPQERLFLQHAWMAMEDAGYTRDSLQVPSKNDLPGQVGIYVGVMYGEYNLSGSLASIANRVSYVLNVHGPSITLDTMCSSSLSSVHLACQDLRSGRTNMAFAGGVNVSIDPNKYQMLSTGQFISSDGHCQSFGEGGDGYIPGEGVGVVMLKRLSDAEKDGDHIYGIIKGSALNHGGKTNGYSVPNPRAQASVISRALRESNTNPRHVSYIEAHGTGTKLGDPIEITALNKAFGIEQENHFCQLGSAKSNIGHCESAAGIAGITKVLLQLQHQQIVPSLHSEKLNPHIDFEHTPFVVNQTLRVWDNPIINGQLIPRIAGVSSFGAGGANAHVIIEEYNTTEKNSVSSVTNTPVAIILSARTKSQLEQKIQDLIYFIENEEKPLDLAAIAYTLQIGREAMDERFAVAVSSVNELVKVLQAYISSRLDATKYHQACVKDYKNAVLDLRSEIQFEDTISTWLEEKDYEKLLAWWTKGLEVSWNELYSGYTPKRISLPTYPFAKESYRLTPAERGRAIVQEASVATIHPLVHQNTSDITETRFSSTFTGKEAFVKDVTIHKEGTSFQVLPFIASLEMAREAIHQALPTQGETHTLSLTNVEFGSWIRAKEAQPVHIALLPKNESSADYEIYSQHEEETIIHAQGYASYTEKNTQKQNIISLRQQMSETVISGAALYTTGTIQYGATYQAVKTLHVGKNQALAHLQLPSEAITDVKHYVLHPSILESTVKSVVGIVSNTEEIASTVIIPISIETVDIHASCTSEMFAWIHYNENYISDSNQIKVDIHLYDTDGNCCVEFIGMLLHTSVESTPKQTNVITVADTAIVQSKKQVAPTTVAPKEIFFSWRTTRKTILSPTTTVEKAPLEKPSGIKLVKPEAAIRNTTTETSLKKIRVQLSEGNSMSMSETEQQSIRLFDNSNGIYTLQLENSVLTHSMIVQFVSALQTAQKQENIKILVIESAKKEFLHGDTKTFNEALHQGLFKEMISFPYPIIANMQGNASGTGFLLGSLCDFMICSEQSVYKTIHTNETLKHLLDERFGNVLVQYFMQPNNNFTGKQLKERGFTMPVIAIEKVSAIVEDITKNLVQKSQISLRLLKQHLARHITTKVSQLQAIEYFNDAQIFETVDVPNLKTIKVHYEKEEACILTIKNTKTKAIQLVKELEEFIAEVNKTNNHPTLVLQSEHANFVPKTINESEVLSFSEILLNCKYPIIITLENTIQAEAWFISLHADEIIYSETAHYTGKGILTNKTLAQRATLMFSHRYGDSASKEILLLGNTYSGKELQKHFPSIQTVPQTKVLSEVLKIAASWSAVATNIRKAQKAATSKELKEKRKQLPVWNIENNKKAQTLSAGVVQLQSSVIKAIAHETGVLEVRMEERGFKNMFTDDFMAGVNEIFEHIENTPHYKVVILTGYDNYFASGGTKEGLVAIQEGKSKFTDTKIFQLAMECNIPVIAAMQGHAIGAGWAMGMYADFTLFSKERKYRSPYMNYGFTPGAGATYIFPKVMGYDLARETLFTANEYSGQELKDKSIHLSVFEKDRVVLEAMELAKKIAENSRDALVAFKKQLTQNYILQAEETKELELTMHDQTFVGDAATLKQIQENFAHKQMTNTVSDANKDVSTIQERFALSDIIETIKKFLANELHLHENEIEEEAQFVDIGLDSITGVTWIRKINDHFTLSLEATQIYTYTTLQQLGTHIQEELQGTEILTQEQNTTAAIYNIEEEKAHEIIEENTIDEALDIVGTIKSFLAQELHLEENEIDETAQFVDIGLDSITGVTWIRKINNHFKTNIEATQIYTYPSLNKLGEFIKEELERLGLIAQHSTVNKKTIVKAPVTKETLEKRVKTVDFIERKLTSLRGKKGIKKQVHKSQPFAIQPIAVVGMAGQFPKAANIDEFWNNIANGENCITEVSKERWDIDEYYNEGTPIPGKTNSKWLGSLEGYDQFDPLFFTISPIEAESMDPQQRLFLQSCWHSIEDAGYNPQSLSGTKCGVFVGCATGDYQLPSRDQQLSAQGFTGGTSSILAARISYFLNLQGPCIALDTACSASLVAIANACDSLITGASDTALAGGVYVMTGPEMHVKTAQSGMLSQDGKCHTFDQEANGFVPGEGVGVVMLKRLEDAERDGDTIYGVIKGWGVNQDGRTNGITAPNAASQTALEQEVYDKYEINPEQIQLIEAHGTGTKLGDPIEVAALKKSFKKYTNKENYCAIGSVKSNIGHCLTAAGVAGFIKVLKAMEHKKLPPTIHYNQLNEHISLQGSPFYVNNQLHDWEVANSEIRHAAISAFGFSGTNAHLVVGEYIPQSVDSSQVKVITQSQKYLVPISARNEEQLDTQVRNILEFATTYAQEIDVVEMAYTLQVGREAMEARVGFMVTSVDELIAKLEAYTNKEDFIKDCYQGHIKENKEGLKLVSGDQEMKELIIQKWISDKKLNKLLDLWTKGLDFDWNILYGNQKPKRVRLPIYPFAKERYWLEPTAISYQEGAQEEKAPKLHPLLHANTANLKAQGFTEASSENEATSAKTKGRKITRINLPTYPFDQEKCWPEPAPKTVETSNKSELVFKNLDSIEDVIERIDGELLDTDEAVLMLKDLL